MKRIQQILTELILLIAGISFSSASTLQHEWEKIEKALFLKEWQQAELYFQKMVENHITEADTFFWNQVKVDTPCRLSMAKMLAEYYKHHHDYNKAFVFYNELLTQTPHAIETLLSCAEMKAKSGKTEEALPLYEQVLLQDSNNLAANIFIGNYYYFTANKECKELKHAYQKLHGPTKMEYALYREKLSKLVTSGFLKAKKHLQQALTIFPSTEIKKVLQQIKMIELENEQ